MDSGTSYEKASFGNGKEDLVRDEKMTKLMHSWEGLNDVERRRRAILRRSEMSFWKVIMFWDGTCLKASTKDWLLWFTVGVYVFCRMQIRLPWIPLQVYDFGNSDIGIIGGFLSFFLVLFVNQTNMRFNEQYKTSMNCEQYIFDMASLVVTVLPKADAARIIRYMNAAHVAGYAGLSKTYSKSTFFDELNKRLGLLAPKERTRVAALDMDSGAACFQEMTTWAMKDIATAQKNDHIDGRLAGSMRDKLLAFRGSMETLYDYGDQPVPFYYIHFLSILSALYLPLFAVSNAYAAGMEEDEIHWSSDIITGLIVLVQAIFVIGLRLLGQQMMDPYGDDEEDLSVLHYVRTGWETSNRILATRFPDDVDPAAEEEVARERASLGGAWEDGWTPKPDDAGNASGLV